MAKRAVRGSRQLARTIKQLSDIHGNEEAAALLGVSTNTVSRWRSAATGRIPMSKVAKHTSTITKWKTRLEAVAPRYVMHEIQQQYTLKDISKTLGITPRRASKAVDYLYTEAGADPIGTLHSAAVMRSELQEKGMRVVEGLRIMPPGSKLIPARHEYKTTFWDESDAIKWARKITGSTGYVFAVEEKAKGKFNVYIDFDEISPEPKKERSRYARAAAYHRWYGTSDAKAIKDIRAYQRRKDHG